MNADQNRSEYFQGTAEQFEAAAERLAQRFPVFCPWCLEEGNRTVIGWSETKGTSWICTRHDEGLKEEIRNIETRICTDEHG